MSIRTKQSLAGFVATDPELTFTSNGDARVYMRVGQLQARFEQNGTFTQLDPEFTDLVMFRKSAELAHEQFRRGDNFIAGGEACTYAGDDGVEREQFVASRIGRDNNITRYTVDRGAPEREARRTKHLAASRCSRRSRSVKQTWTPNHPPHPPRARPGARPSPTNPWGVHAGCGDHPHTSARSPNPPLFVHTRCSSGATFTQE